MNEKQPKVIKPTKLYIFQSSQRFLEWNFVRVSHARQQTHAKFTKVHIEFSHILDWLMTQCAHFIGAITSKLFVANDAWLWLRFDEPLYNNDRRIDMILIKYLVFVSIYCPCGRWSYHCDYCNRHGQNIRMDIFVDLSHDFRSIEKFPKVYVGIVIGFIPFDLRFDFVGWQVKAGYQERWTISLFVWYRLLSIITFHLSNRCNKLCLNDFAFYTRKQIPNRKWWC